MQSDRHLKISVITPCFNSAATIRETIESVLKQDYPHLEHIVTDGGSTDGTLDILREYPHLNCSSEKDEGIYHAMHKGILRASGEVVAVLNSDDTYHDGTLQEVAKALSKNHGWDGLFGDLIYMDGQGKKICTHRDAVFDYDVLRYYGCYVVHPTLFLKKSVYLELGGFRYKEFLHLCDFDLLLRLGREKYKIGHIRKYLANYRFHDGGQSADMRVRRNSKREADILRKEHGCPGGIYGKLMHSYGRLRRQFQKFVRRGQMDLIPGSFFINRHLKARTNFSSNISLDKLEA
jgi:glycosyltransferase involved in cell wall biosynthesis